MCLKIQPLCLPPKSQSSDVEVGDVQSVFLDEFAPGFDVVAHHVALAKSVTTFMSRGAKVYVSNDNLSVSHQRRRSDVEVCDVEGVFLDEFAARFDVVTHQDAEDFVGGGGIVHADLQE